MSDLTAKLEKAGKITGAIMALVAATVGLSSWLFSIAMSDRDRESEELREDVDALKTQLRETSENATREFTQLDEDFDDLRMALIALRAELTFRTAPSSAAPPTVTLRRRTPRAPAGAPATLLSSGGSGYGTGSGRLSDSPPPSDVIELRDANAAADAYNDALERMDEP